MNELKVLFLLLGLWLSSAVCAQETKIYDVADFGLRAGSKKTLRLYGLKS